MIKPRGQSRRSLNDTKEELERHEGGLSYYNEYDNNELLILRSVKFNNRSIRRDKRLKR